jgi:hypothetical protein
MYSEMSDVALFTVNGRETVMSRLALLTADRTCLGLDGTSWTV